MDIFSPIGALADWTTYSALRLGRGSYWGDASNFFIYDSIKIGLLLFVINYIMAITRYCFPLEKARDILAKRKWLGMNYIMAALLGVVTPFCSCSSIPLFIGFLGAGIPLGVTFAFLISSPLINESSLYLFPALFGLKITLAYNLIGLAVAVLGGMAIQALNLERFVRPEILKLKSRAQVEAEAGGESLGWKKLAKYWLADSMQITKQIFPYMLLGVGLGALIHGFVPASLAEKYLSNKGWWAVPSATLLGVPFYANSVSVIPIMEALAQKGVPVGTALAFMTGIVTLSIPEALILKKVMKWQLLAVFFGITILGIMAMGYTLNFIS